MSRIKEENEAIYTGRGVCSLCGMRDDAHFIDCPHAVAILSQDNVTAPAHYRQGDVECIDAIESALTAEEFRGHCKANALKYIWRERYKGQDESLKKAIWYLERALKA